MKKNHTIVTIGGATQDIYLAYQGADTMNITERGGQRSYMLFESGSKVEVEDILYHTGGGATNSAVSLRRLGFNVACFCMIGNDRAGQSIVDVLQREGVNTDNIITSKKHASGMSFVIHSLSRERTIFAYRGANGFLRKTDIPFALIEQANQLYITSLSNESANLLETIVAHAKKHKIPVAINPGKSQLLKGAQALKKSLQYIDILILNSSEAKTFMTALVESDEHCSDVFEWQGVPYFFKKVMSLGPQIVVVTDGANGVYVAVAKNGTADGFMLFHPSMSVDVVDTLGAGDSFGSCFVGCLQHGLAVEDALRYGIINSASVIGHMGAKPGLLEYPQLEKRVKKFKPDLLQRYAL